MILTNRRRIDARLVRWPLHLCLGALLAACASAPTVEAEKVPKATVVQAQPAATSVESLQAEKASTSSRSPEIFAGTAQLYAQQPPKAAETTSPTGPAITLNFIDVDLRTVISSLLGDALGIRFTIDPSIKGTITLQSAKPLPKDDLLAALESTLRLQDIAMVEHDGSYSIVPMREVQREVPRMRTPDAAQAAGFGVDVVPLRYTGALEIQKLLGPFASGGGIQIDESRNLLFLGGTAQERASLRDIVQMFDVDWLAGMSFAMVPVEYADPKTVTEELKEIILEPKSPLNGIVKLIPLSRINTILVASPQASYLPKVSDWIKRLDLGNSSPGRRIYVYDVQNSRAADLAHTLGQIFGINTGSSSSSNDTASRGFGSNSLSTLTGGGGLSTSGGTLSTSLSPTPYPAYRNDEPRQVATGSGSGGSFGDVQGLRIVPSEENNSILVLATPSEFGIIENALKRLDVMPRQVLIESSVAEVTLNNQLQYGVQWSFLSSRNNVSLSQSASSTISPQFPGLNYIFSSGTAIEAVLSALDSVTKVKVLSSPKLLVLNNHQAEIQVGDQVPILTQQAISVGQTGAPIVNSVAQQNTGVILHITPRVNKNGVVILDIDQEISAVTPTTSSNINSPTIQQRRISTTISVRDGETIALGGLISESNSKNSAGVPWLSRIPVLGALFGSINNTINRTELFVLLKPRVVQSGQDLDDVMHDLRKQFEGVVPAVPGEPRH